MSDTVSAAAEIAVDTAVPEVQPAVAVSVEAPAASAAPSEAPIGLGTSDDPIIVPAGTQEALKALHEGGLRDADVSKYLETVPEGLRDHVKSLIAGTTELEFREADPVEVQAAPEPGHPGGKLDRGVILVSLSRMTSPTQGRAHPSISPCSKGPSFCLTTLPCASTSTL